MGVPQPGIFALGTRAHHHLELDLTGPAEALRPRLTELLETVTTIAGTNVVIGFGPTLWAELAPGEVPPDLVPFEELIGAEGFTMPASQHDLWLWLHGGGPDSVLHAAREAVALLADVATLADEQACFTYLASQDLSGFEDGTENPPVHEAVTAASIPDGTPGAGGSIALVQRWVHDLAALDALPVEAREAVIGRTLDGSEELPEETRPTSSHISRVVIEDDEGEELEVFRRSTAWGDSRRHGLLFVAFSADRARLLRMLERMAGAEDGERDALTRFSTPETGAWYVVPPVGLLPVEETDDA